jgi:CRISPR/Cas system-associated exonuclease Cas4 (RecB family)
VGRRWQVIAQPEDTGKLEELVGAQIEKDRGEHVSRVDYPHAYASEAGACRRKVAFRVAGFDRTEPMDIHGQVATRMGTDLHDLVEKALSIDGVMHEVAWQLVGYKVTGRSDLVGQTTVAEIKSMHSYPFEMAVHGIRGSEPSGPKMEHLLQAAMGAEALDKDQVRLIYVNKARTVKTETFAQFTVDYDGELRASTVDELQALSHIVDAVADDKLVAREYNGEVIENPTGTRWPCGYCGWKSLCAELPSGTVEIASVKGTRS